MKHREQSRRNGSRAPEVHPENVWPMMNERIPVDPSIPTDPCKTGAEKLETAKKR
jgi:hypothetical protein